MDLRKETLFCNLKQFLCIYSALQENDQALQNKTDDHSDGHSMSNSLTNSVCGDQQVDRSESDDKLEDINSHDSADTNR